MKYINEATRINQSVEKQSKNQKVIPSRTTDQLDFSVIETYRDKLKKIWENNLTNNKNNLAYLTICLYTLQPPLRLDYKNMEIVDTPLKVMRKKDQNYLLKNNLMDKTYTIIINKDKVIKSHGKGKIPIIDNDLNKIIDESLKIFPRKYLLSKYDNGDVPIGKQGLELLLRYIFKPFNISVDILRSAYITNAFSNPKMTLQNKEDLMKQMRSSLNMAEVMYKKIPTVTKAPI